MTLADLQRFCDPNRAHLRAPWSHGSFSYAATGIVILRTDRLADVAESELAPQPEAVNKLFGEARFDGCAALLPELPAEKSTPCKKCKGLGKFIRCARCKGKDVRECECLSCGDVHEKRCGDCGGDGLTPSAEGTEPCENCHGSGKQIPPQPIQMNGCQVQARFLRLIATLPGVKFGAAVSEYDPVPFSFEGGIGLVMPYKGTP